jgi:hypothetical protein
MSRHIPLKRNLMPRLRSLLWRWKSLSITFALVFPFSILLTQQARGDDLAIFGSMAIAFENLATTFLSVNKAVAARKYDGVIFAFHNNYNPATNAQVTAGNLVNTPPQASSARGDILFTGGIGNRGLIGLVDIYNPVTATWMGSGNLAIGLPANTTSPPFNMRALVWCSFIVAF